MSVGEWVDNRTTFFFKKLALSADVDSLAENDHRLLVQGGSMPLTHFSVPLSGAGQGYHEVPSATSEYMPFTLNLNDRCPWNRMLVSIFMRQLGAAGFVRLHKIDPGGTPSYVQIANQAGPFVSPGSRVDFSIDITGYATGLHEFALQVFDSGAAVRWWGAHVQLMSTVTGLVS